MTKWWERSRVLQWARHRLGYCEGPAQISGRECPLCYKKACEDAKRFDQEQEAKRIFVAQAHFENSDERWKKLIGFASTMDGAKDCCEDYLQTLKLANEVDDLYRYIIVEGIPDLADSLITHYYDVCAGKILWQHQCSCGRPVSKYREFCAICKARTIASRGSNHADQIRAIREISIRRRIEFLGKLGILDPQDVVEMLEELFPNDWGQDILDSIRMYLTAREDYIPSNPSTVTNHLTTRDG